MIKIEINFQTFVVVAIYLQNSLFVGISFFCHFPIGCDHFRSDSIFLGDIKSEIVTVPVRFTCGVRSAQVRS